MFGFGNKYLRKQIIADVLSICDKSNLIVEIDKNYCHRETAAGVFLYYSNKEKFIELKSLIDRYNSNLKVLKKLAPTEYKNEEYKDYPVECRIILDKKIEKNSYSVYTLLHELGHFMQYKTNTNLVTKSSAERNADRYILKYFKTLPRYVSFIFREDIRIFSNCSRPLMMKYLNLKESSYFKYSFQNIIAIIMKKKIRSGG